MQSSSRAAATGPPGHFTLGHIQLLGAQLQDETLQWNNHSYEKRM